MTTTKTTTATTTRTTATAATTKTTKTKQTTKTTTTTRNVDEGLSLVLLSSLKYREGNSQKCPLCSQNPGLPLAELLLFVVGSLFITFIAPDIYTRSS